MTTIHLARALRVPVILTALGLTGCIPAYDPLIRDGLWRPAYTNRADLGMMVASPADLVRGVGAPGSDGQLATAAVERLRAGKVKKLPDAGITEIKVQNQGADASGGS